MKAKHSSLKYQLIPNQLDVNGSAATIRVVVETPHGSAATIRVVVETPRGSRHKFALDQKIGAFTLK